MFFSYDRSVSIGWILLCLNVLLVLLSQCQCITVAPINRNINNNQRYDSRQLPSREYDSRLAKTDQINRDRQAAPSTQSNVRREQSPDRPLPVPQPRDYHETTTRRDGLVRATPPVPRPGSNKPYIPPVSKASFQINRTSRNYQQQRDVAQTSPRRPHYETQRIYQVSPPDVTLSKPPSFETLRNQIQILKDKQKKFFSSEGRDFNIFAEQQKETETSSQEESSEENSPTPNTAYEIYHRGEDDYTEEKKNFENNLRSPLSNLFAPNSDEAVPYEHSQQLSRPQRQQINQSPKKFNSKFNHKFHTKSLNNVRKQSNNDAEEAINSESKSNNNFLPYRMLASVRHQETYKKVPSSISDPRLRERLQEKKVHTLYTEQGYDDENYDHDNEHKFAEHKDVVHRRRKREVNVTETRESKSVKVEDRPMSLALISNRRGLSGEDLLRYIATVIRNSTKYLPYEIDDENIEVDSTLLNDTEVEEVQRMISDQILKHDFTADEKHIFENIPLDERYPFYDDDRPDIPDYSPIRYAEDLKNIDKTNYQKRLKKCELIRLRQPIPQQIRNHNFNGHTNSNEDKRRLIGLSDQLDCYKENLFGKIPLDNPIFEEEYVTQPGPIFNLKNKHVLKPPYRNYDRPSNPLISVYDDVISNIRTSLITDMINKTLKDRLVKLAKAKSTEEAVHPREAVVIQRPTNDDSEQSFSDFQYQVVKQKPRDYIIRKRPLRKQPISSESEINETTEAPLNNTIVKFLGNNAIAIAKFPVIPPANRNHLSNYGSDEKRQQYVNPLSDPSEYPIFDISQFIPKLYMVHPNGKMYSITLKRKQKINQQQPQQQQTESSEPKFIQQLPLPSTTYGQQRIRYVRRPSEQQQQVYDNQHEYTIVHDNRYAYQPQQQRPSQPNQYYVRDPYADDSYGQQALHRPVYYVQPSQLSPVAQQAISARLRKTPYISFTGV